MKIITIVSIAFAAASAIASPSENTFAGVTNDWYNASFTNVYELAQARLAANTNDVVGAYLMYDWDISFSSTSSISNSLVRVMRVSDAVEVPAFTNVYNRCRPSCIRFLNEYLPSQREEDRPEKQRKSQQPHGFMPSEYMLKLLWDNGLW